MTEPVYDVAHLGRVQLLTPDLSASVRFFVEVLGMDEVDRSDGSVYLRAWGDYERASLQLTAADNPGPGTISWRATSEASLERRVAAVEATGRGLGWRDGTAGHGPAYHFTDPDGHPMAVYYGTEYYVPDEDQAPALKNQPQRMPACGVGVRRIDHVNVWCQDINANSDFLVDQLGFRISEHIVEDSGRQLGSWLHVTPKSYDLAYGRIDPAGVGGRLHHVAYAVDAREYVLRAADIFLDAGVPIEAGPAKHTIQQTCFLYAFEPGGNRIEVITDGRLLLAPDRPAVTWTPEERKRGQAWGTLMPESWFSYATPPS
ncbi:MAG: catechol 2,3-dioxygenase [Pseudonocardiaceae bacterium]|nr:catechol 2,3-dioxygenase [Pseudonocardiaceae bacterium]